MLISDWSSDVCSSDLWRRRTRGRRELLHRRRKCGGRKPGGDAPGGDSSRTKPAHGRAAAASAQGGGSRDRGLWSGGIPGAASGLTRATLGVPAAHRSGTQTKLSPCASKRPRPGNGKCTAYTRLSSAAARWEKRGRKTGPGVLPAGTTWGQSGPSPKRRRLTGALNGLLPGHRHAAFPASCAGRSAEHTSELQSLMRSSYAVFCLKKKQ